jgi:hypothetical protein
MTRSITWAVRAAFLVGAEPSLRAMPLSVALTPVWAVGVFVAGDLVEMGNRDAAAADGGELAGAGAAREGR